MKQDPPMPEEIRNDFYPDFENGWHRTELAGRTVMVIFLIICLLGYLGNGYWGHQIRRSADGLLRVEYEPVVRFATPAHFTLHASLLPGQSALAITLPTELSKSFGLQQVTPRPSVWLAGSDGFQLTFPVRSEQREAAIQVDGIPNTTGFAPFSVKDGKGESLSWSQFVAP